MLTAAQTSRLRWVVTGFLVAAVLLWGRLFWLQIVKPNHWVEIARRQQIQVLELPPARGAIRDRNLNPLAVSVRLSSVFADPRHVKSSAKAAAALAPLLERSEETLEQELNQKNRGFVWLKRKIPNRVAGEIRSLRLPGIHLLQEPQRVYPHGYLASHLIGFAGLDDQGLEGLELAFDAQLKGQPGWRWLGRDARRRPIGIWDAPRTAPRNGLDVVLTIDTTIQYLAEAALDRAFYSSNALSGSIVVMDPMTGEILAMASRPTFDPNNFEQAPAQNRRNRSITDTFEPGSVFKVVTAAVALGTQTVQPEDQFFCENGEFWVAGRILHDHKPHGWLSFRDVIVRSSNIGVAKAAMQVGPQALYNGMIAFGFGKPTGIEFPGEVGGVVKPPTRWSKPSITAIPMGHEVSVTALQLAQGISVVANGGWLVQPRLVREIREPGGGPVEEFQSKAIRRVITPECAVVLQKILTGVVDEGTGRRAQIPGVTVAGKTGTAQKIEPTGGYSHSKFVASFIGFAPVENPRLAIVVTFDEPHPAYYGGTVAAPVFREVAEGVLVYLQQQDWVRTAHNVN